LATHSPSVQVSPSAQSASEVQPVDAATHSPLVQVSPLLQSESDEHCVLGGVTGQPAKNAQPSASANT